MKLIKNVVAILLLSWFGLTCFKLGWYSRDNPLVRPVVSSVLGLEKNKRKEAEFGLWSQIQEAIGNEAN
ncbi:MAG: hypothetical protein AAF383_01215 [Cyanobacteria bacterium P01_A01_bin.83]